MKIFVKFQEINGASFSGHVLNLKKNGLSQRGGGRGGSACLCENSQTLINLLKGTFPKKEGLISVLGRRV